MRATTSVLCVVVLVLGTGLALLGQPAVHPIDPPDAPLPETAGGPAVESPVARRLAPAALAGLALEPGSQEDLHAWRAATQGVGAHAIAELRQVALTATHSAVVGACLSALGRLDAVVGDDALLGLLDDPRLRVRQDVVTALGHSRDARALEVLAGAAAASDAALRPLVIQAMGRIGGTRACDLLRALAIDGPASPTDAAFLRAALRVAVNPSADAQVGPRGVPPAPQSTLTPDFAGFEPVTPDASRATSDTPPGSAWPRSPAARTR